MRGRTSQPHRGCWNWTEMSSQSVRPSDRQKDRHADRQTVSHWNHPSDQSIYQ